MIPVDLKIANFFLTAHIKIAAYNHDVILEANLTVLKDFFQEKLL